MLGFRFELGLGLGISIGLGIIGRVMDRIRVNFRDRVMFGKLTNVDRSLRLG